MAREHWQSIVKKYADGRPICNCGDAYYSPCGEGYLNGVHKMDMLMCQFGCSSNQIQAKEEIAEKILKEMEHK